LKCGDVAGTHDSQYSVNNDGTMKEKDCDCKRKMKRKVTTIQKIILNKNISELRLRLIGFSYLALISAVVTWRKADSMFVAVLADVSRKGIPKLSA
jgi:L-cystine uptake protein TcyP (sodium:dicarboxylate symporter family)